jgi:hypothetical protein
LLFFHIFVLPEAQKNSRTVTLHGKGQKRFNNSYWLPSVLYQILAVFDSETACQQLKGRKNNIGKLKNVFLWDDGQKFSGIAMRNFNNAGVFFSRY